MPTAYIKKMAKKHHISVDKSEEYWEKAKKLAQKEHPDDFAIITTIYKKMLGERTFKEYYYDTTSVI